MNRDRLSVNANDKNLKQKQQRSFRMIEDKNAPMNLCVYEYCNNF